MTKKKTPQLFEIYSTSKKTSLLKAFAEELIEIGYSVEYLNNINTADIIFSRSVKLDEKLTNKEAYSQLTINKPKELSGKNLEDYNKFSTTKFSIPEQWNEALKFAKTQLNLSYWEEYKIYNINGYDIKINEEALTIKVDKYIIPFEEVIMLYDFNITYYSKFKCSEAIPSIIIGCQTVELKDLKELALKLKKILFDKAKKHLAE